MPEASHTVVMTGATRGIGLQAAPEILRRSPEAHLVILARAASGAEVLPRLRDVSPNVSVMDTDLASKASTEAAATKVQDLLVAREIPELRGLVFNAGVHVADAQHASADGYELTFAVNVLSTHLLLRRLHSRLEGPARIVVTVSDAHFGDLRHTGGSFPAPRRTSPELLATPGTSDRPSSVRAGRQAYATASWQPFTSYTNGPGACPQVSTSSRTTRAS